MRLKFNRFGDPMVQDNLNTHKLNSFYGQLSAGETFVLIQRFDWHYTPKSASWLNMIEPGGRCH